MPLNLLKKYNQLLELAHFNERQRDISLRGVFDRDIADNPHFKFQEKTIRPIKIDGEPALDTLFSHLTRRTEENEDGIKSRTIYDPKRYERLHWIWHLVQEKEAIKIFSYKDRFNGRDVIRTYLFDEKENYVIVLEPYRSTKDYYLLSAYYLEEKYGGPKIIAKKYQRRLDEVY
ncbi:hypothetical protein SDC9_110800 [bioreactor metagenome]|uniref:Phage-Barnase-EndoU-ColicinE5/D-RelE like nuclease 2 domain-containing protein n=1 Tax=bioreactor metagenome TaxID=1076179 RepID=A0A645BFK6_9ZZZZ